MKFKYFDEASQNFLCTMCVLEKTPELVEQPSWVDLTDKTRDVISKFEEKCAKIETLNKRVKQFKASLKSGKHIDVFFDNLIQPIIKLHNNTKEQYRDAL